MLTLDSNIHAQPESLTRTLQYQCGDGAAAIAHAAALLRSGRRIVITAMGASLFASIPLQYSLCSMGLDATAVEAGELLHYQNSAWKDAIVLMVSRSGESVEIAKLLERMKGIVPIIGVSNEPVSQLARSADVSLSIASLKDEIVAIQTYTGTLLTLHLLAGAVAESSDTAAEEVRRLLPAFTSLVETSMHTLTDWDAFLTPNPTPYLLARGPSLASAHEGALLFHEVAKNPAIAMPIASFRHGPVEVVDANFRGIVFVPQDQTRDLNLSLARDLNLSLARDLVRFGGRICLIGPAGPHMQNADWCSLPSASPTLAPIFEIVPLQAATFQFAILRGIEPGSFRYAPQVAVNEASFSQH
jgi:glucosamine--fructose-6-phosphate aminotransferase (isomerizing)